MAIRSTQRRSVPSRLEISGALATPRCTVLAALFCNEVQLRDKREVVAYVLELLQR
jgi:hypothetical protein